MKSIKLEDVTKAVKEAFISINYNYDENLLNILKQKKQQEEQFISKTILQDLIENADIAKTKQIPLCQDTGVAVVFLEIGKNVTYQGDIYEAINEGVRQAYQVGYLRKSIVSHPINRVNTNDNTPAIIHTKIIPGEQIKLKLTAKGGGSENMSLVKMLTPAEGIDGIKKLVIDSVIKAGGKPCPPIILGIGIGGNFEKSALLAKEALLRDIFDHATDPIARKLEDDLYREINNLNIGPMGVGGKTTCLAVKVNIHPCHIASLPVAINFQCHSSRHTEVIL